MKRFQHIFVAVKPGVAPRAALAQAISLAELTGGRLRLVSAVDRMPRISEIFFHSATSELEDTLVAEAAENLAELATGIRGRGVTVETSVVRGNPVIALIQEVLREKADAVFKDIHEDELSHHGTISSDDTRLLRKCPCPVWLVKPGEHETFDRILVAVESDADSEERVILNRKLMEMATSLAIKEKATLHIVQAWRVYGEEMLSHRMENEDFEKYRENAFAVVKKNFDALVDPFRALDLQMEEHILKGEPESVILSVLKDENINLLIMGTVARTGFPGLIIGNTAERVLQVVDRSVLAVKPDGFVSPITID